MSKQYTQLNSLVLRCWRTCWSLEVGKHMCNGNSTQLFPFLPMRNSNSVATKPLTSSTRLHDIRSNNFSHISIRHLSHFSRHATKPEQMRRNEDTHHLELSIFAQLPQRNQDLDPCCDITFTKSFFKSGNSKKHTHIRTYSMIWESIHHWKP